MLVEVEKIRIDAGTQSRQSINEAVVSEYFDALESGEEFPPVVVFSDGLAYYLADGFHRYLAHKRAKVDLIPAEVKSGTLRDAVLFSLSANSKHGLRRTAQDKRKSVLTALDDLEWSELSDRQIAAMCGVSHPFVASIRKEIAAPSESVTAPKPEPTGNVTSPQSGNVTTQSDDDDMENDVIAEMLAENERLRSRLAVEAMDASEEEKTMAQETIESLREDVKRLQIELNAVKRSRDQYMTECSELKRQVKMYQNQLKRMS